MNKKLLLASVLLLAGIGAFAQALNTFPMPWGNGNFSSTFGGVFYSNANRATFRERKVDLSQYDVIGPVKGYAEMGNVLLLVNWGDTSLGKLKAEALKNIDADDIVNIEIDTCHFNVFVFYIKCEVHLRGIAIKYKKSAAKKD